MLGDCSRKLSGQQVTLENIERWAKNDFGYIIKLEYDSNDEICATARSTYWTERLIDWLPDCFASLGLIRKWRNDLNNEYKDTLNLFARIFHETPPAARTQWSKDVVHCAGTNGAVRLTDRDIKAYPAGVPQILECWHADIASGTYTSATPVFACSENNAPQELNASSLAKYLVNFPPPGCAVGDPVAPGFLPETILYTQSFFP